MHPNPAHGNNLKGRVRAVPVCVPQNFLHHLDEGPGLLKSFEGDGD